GGSNFAGFAFPMIGRRIKGKTDCEFLAAESDAAPSMTAGKYRYDLGDTGGFTPELMMHTMGHDFIPSPVHAGGLRYHGMAPLVSAALDQGFMTARSYGQPETFRAGKIFAETEGIIAAPESCHAIQAAIDKALEYKAAKEKKTIVFCLSGHGLLDLYGYEKYLSGKLEESAV
ncbi:MAG: pyridoxal-phosphate dependent enzyme, partial [Thermoplasmatales archaeon]|nr:pyridoxal-phosphate dependent enzyme [Thermoplasmatales archaeon]